MANSYLNIVTFLLTTVFYYLALKPALPYAIYSNKEEYTNYVSNNYTFLAVYVLLVIMIQFLVNSSIIAETCGGNISQNMGASGLYTFIPWALIFGVLVVVLSIYPGFKSAFSDVIGYYFVSSSANKYLTELLQNKQVETKINEDPNVTPESKQALESAADTILKILGNTSLLINQIVPSNFEQYWGILTPLMKDKYRVDSPETLQMKSNIFELVVTRDNVGEAMWYIYTGLLLTSIVQMKLTSRGCTSNPQIMESNYQKFVDQQQKNKEKTDSSETTYTLSS